MYCGVLLLINCIVRGWYGDNSLDLRALTVGQKYYFAIESFNENGISQRVFFFERRTDCIK